MAHLREYRIRDRADNETVVLKVRCSPVSWELSVRDVRYDDQCHAEAADRRSALRPTRRRTEHNTIVFHRVLGKGLDHPLLAVQQVVSLGDGDKRSTVRARYDESIVGHETGSRCGEAGTPSDSRGPVLLHVSTDNGRLAVDS